MSNINKIIDMIGHIDSSGEGLTEWEINFIADLIDNPPKTYTEKQIKVIYKIYYGKC